MVSWCIVKYRMFVFLLLSHENKKGKSYLLFRFNFFKIGANPQQWRIPFFRPQANARGREDHPLNSRRDGMAVPCALCPVHSASVTYHEQERAAAHPFLSPKQAPTAMRGRRCVICNPRTHAKGHPKSNAQCICTPRLETLPA